MARKLIDKCAFARSRHAGLPNNADSRLSVHARTISRTLSPRLPNDPRSRLRPLRHARPRRSAGRCPLHRSAVGRLAIRLAAAGNHRHALPVAGGGEANGETPNGGAV